MIVETRKERIAALSDADFALQWCAVVADYGLAVKYPHNAHVVLKIAAVLADIAEDAERRGLTFADALSAETTRMRERDTPRSTPAQRP